MAHNFLENKKNSTQPFSKIIFGAWGIKKDADFYNVSEKDSLKALARAVDLGFTSIDTAPGYGFGYSERVVAKVVESISRDSIQIITECGIVWGGEKRGVYTSSAKLDNGKTISSYLYANKNSIIKECENSLKRLKTDYIDLYTLIERDSTTPIEETAEAFQLLKQSGKIRFGGIGNFAIDDYKKACDYFDFQFVKARYNMLNRRIDEQLVPFCKKTNKKILAYDCHQRGILTGRSYPEFYFRVGESDFFTRYYKPDNKEKIRKFLNNLTYLAIEKGITLANLTIAWVLAQDAVSSVLLAASHIDQIVDDGRAAEVILSMEDVAYINSNIDFLMETID
ncbi:aldo/keto reductase [Olivibacter sp. CPCC 100613]|uniref:aldo/keto reductase n=1 Tax=Olivibacter sp. CPCC 100613 TaxID=3079931 RepID=UPI002FF5F88F